jgi:thymidylate synthase ThyX
MKPEAYERTLRARAFDIARYLLPLATNTSLGQIVNARTLESQVSRLLSHTHREVRRLGEQLKRAAREPAYNLNHAAWRKLVEEIAATDTGLAERAANELLKDVRVSPTLVKYADPNPYELDTRKELRQAAAELMRGTNLARTAPVDRVPGDLLKELQHTARELMRRAESTPADAVDLLEDEPLEVELPTTLLYEHCHFPYRQLRERVEAMGERQRQEITNLGLRHRGKHDELLRPFCAGQKFRFDILMDIGGFRDLHRHRRCVQIGQGFTTAHGFDTPPEVSAAGLGERYDSTMRAAAGAATSLAAQLQSKGAAEPDETSQYLIPLGYRKRTLFKMDFAEVVYIAELRTTPAGHFSYRNVAYGMYQEVAKRYPALASYFRVHDISEPVDLLQR